MLNYQRVSCTIYTVCIYIYTHNMYVCTYSMDQYRWWCQLFASMFSHIWDSQCSEHILQVKSQLLPPCGQRKPGPIKKCLPKSGIFIAQHFWQSNIVPTFLAIDMPLSSNIVLVPCFNYSAWWLSIAHSKVFKKRFCVRRKSKKAVPKMSAKEKAHLDLVSRCGWMTRLRVWLLLAKFAIYNRGSLLIILDP